MQHGVSRDLVKLLESNGRTPHTQAHALTTYVILIRTNDLHKRRPEAPRTKEFSWWFSRRFWPSASPWNFGVHGASTFSNFEFPQCIMIICNGAHAFSHKEATLLSRELPYLKIWLRQDLKDSESFSNLFRLCLSDVWKEEKNLFWKTDKKRAAAQAREPGRDIYLCITNGSTVHH